MEDMYEEFEKRYTDKWFSAGWVEIEAQKHKSAKTVEYNHKDLATLENELEMLNDNMDEIVEKQLRLANLAKLYN